MKEEYLLYADAEKLHAHQEIQVRELQLSMELVRAVERLNKVFLGQTDDRYRLLLRQAMNLRTFIQKIAEFNENFETEIIQRSREMNLLLSKGSDTLTQAFSTFSE